VDVDMRDFLARSHAVVNHDQEILGVKHHAETSLCFGDTVHQHPPFVGQKVGQTGHTTLRDHEGVARSPWKHVEESVPSISTGNGVRRKFA
jgi:fructose-specific component phosphotransferase system IIB-like protein